MGGSITGGTPKWIDYNGKTWKNPTKWMIWGYPDFRKPPYGKCCCPETIVAAVGSVQSHCCQFFSILGPSGAVPPFHFVKTLMALHLGVFIP
jgi:hypothetical protein